jgi:hypothetical protein
VCVCLRARGGVRAAVGTRAKACDCVRVALLIQHATRVCFVVIYGLWLHHIFDIVT